MNATPPSTVHVCVCNIYAAASFGIGVLVFGCVCVCTCACACGAGYWTGVPTAQMLEVLAFFFPIVQSDAILQLVKLK